MLYAFTRHYWILSPLVNKHGVIFLWGASGVNETDKKYRGNFFF